jgi:hypothetical protein
MEKLTTANTKKKKKKSSFSIRSCSFFHPQVVVWPDGGPDEGLKHVAT